MSAVAPRWRRVPILAVVLAVPIAVGALDRTPAVRDVVQWLCSYSPSRLVHGAVWTLPASALLEAQPARLGANVLVPTVVFAPYLLWVGTGRALRTFFAGHVVATLAAAAAILLGVLTGSAVAHRLYTMHDNGVSAGLSAAAGALGVLLWFSRARPLAALVLGVVLVLFTYRIASESVGATLADGEHLLAIAVGAAVELRRRLSAARPPRSIPARPSYAP
ncbi:MAG TPA: rhomboid-like protein [Acidimicrobiia bacterium]|nr:rhomboid-like protein [Acidimicrobiia bacterium]